MADMSRKELLQKIRELEFAGVELNLFLDNHPNDQKALMDFNTFSKELTACVKEYEMKYGPLMNFGFSPSAYPWQWVNEPWPWEGED